MAVIILLVICSLLVSSGFLIAFLWASRSGQFDDTSTPAVRMLFEETPVQKCSHGMTNVIASASQTHEI